MKRSRWIRIGEVRAGWYVLRGCCGFPGGLFLNWSGRVSWCQPCEFLDWRELMWAVRRRVRLARMELVACASRRAQTPWIELRVLVRRESEPLRLDRLELKEYGTRTDGVRGVPVVGAVGIAADPREGAGGLPSAWAPGVPDDGREQTADLRGDDALAGDL